MIVHTSVHSKGKFQGEPKVLQRELVAKVGTIKFRGGNERSGKFFPVWLRKFLR